MSKKRVAIFVVLFLTLLLSWAVLNALIAAAENDQHDIGQRITIIIETYVKTCSKVTPASSQNTSTPGDSKPLATAPAPVTAAMSAPDAELTPRGVWMNTVIAPKLDMVQRVTNYCRAMGVVITDEEIRYNCDLAYQGGYDSRLWCVIAMAESPLPPRPGVNIYGYCGGDSGPWAYVPGGWKEQSDWFNSRVTTFYAQSVDITQPSHILFYHYRGDPVTYDPYSVFYVRNVMSWLVAI